MIQKQLRQHIVHELWKSYRLASADMRSIENALATKGVHNQFLDHFAIIDLPGPNTGIPYLRDLFTIIGYSEKGRDYLADKQNDFLWMAETDCEQLPAHQVLPQVVVADFRLEELPPEVRKIIEKYSNQAKASPLDRVRHLLQQASSGNTEAAPACANILLDYFSGRDWPLPTVAEFHTVRDFNELLAWVLVFGRRPNHFTLSIHLCDHFSDLTDFHNFIEQEVKLPLNQEGGILKGGKMSGIAQGSTNGTPENIQLMDGNVNIPTGFIEFVYRYPRSPTHQPPKLWNDYFTGFIATHANKVIESLWSGRAGA